MGNVNRLNPCRVLLTNNLHGGITYSSNNVVAFLKLRCQESPHRYRWSKDQWYREWHFLEVDLESDFLHRLTALFDMRCDRMW